jgi:hydroxylamine reductase
MKPRVSYVERCYTTGAVGYENVKFIKNDDWDVLIKVALELKGFKDEAHCKQITDQIKNTKITGVVGFNHRVFDSLAPTLLSMIKDGKIKGFRFVGGCDGVNKHRNVFTEAAENAPNGWIVLTGACGRFKVNRSELGSIDGVPRLLDVGQCNDVFSAIMILVKLSTALGCGVNDLPLELFVSWYEQKAIVQFLTLLSLGVKNIKLGPTAPVCITEAVFNILKEKFNVSIFLLKKN